MKILVTGGAGFIGTNLVKRLVEEGHEVVCLDNFSTGKHSNKIEGARYIDMDLTKLELVWQWQHFVRYDVVYHLAAIARIQPSFHNPIGYFEANAVATMNLAKMCAEANTPLIYAGSSSHHSGLYSNPYTFSKSIGEEILHMIKYNYDLKFAIARFYNVYGPYQLTEGGYTTLIGRWINNIEKGLPCEIYGDGEQRRDFTHVDDIVDGLLKMNTSLAYGKTFELGRGKNYSVNEVAEMFNIDPIYKDPKPGEARNTLCESSLAKEILGWEPKKELVSYIKSYKYENITNPTK